MALRRRKNSPRRRVYRSRVRRNPVRHHRRRTAKRNAYPLAGLAINPRRRRRTHRRNPVMRAKHRRHHYRRNPALLGLQLPAINQVLFAGLGFVGIPMVQGLVTPFIPASMVPTTPAGKYVAYAAYGFGLTYAVKAFAGAEQAKMTAIGAAAFIVTQAIKDFMPGVLPGLGAYVAPTQMSAYVRGSGPTMQSLGVPGGSFPGAVDNALPTRFRRF